MGPYQIGRRRSSLGAAGAALGFVVRVATGGSGQVRSSLSPEQEQAEAELAAEEREARKRQEEADRRAEDMKARAASNARAEERRVAAEVRLHAFWRLHMNGAPGLDAEIAKLHASESAKQILREWEQEQRVIREAQRAAKEAEWVLKLKEQREKYLKRSGEDRRERARAATVFGSGARGRAGAGAGAGAERRRRRSAKAAAVALAGAQRTRRRRRPRSPRPRCSPLRRIVAARGQSWSNPLARCGELSTRRVTG